ncbi:MAG: TonB-dependent receptor [Acidobacteria bacterium]|nr:TonB-dependent receptor [Acidobacteriota bacterium]
MTITRLFWTLTTVVLMILAAANRCEGQTTSSTLVGTATDPNGAVVPGAKVTARCMETNLTYQSTSNELGNYQIERLARGTYVVSAEASGFQRLDVKDVALVSNDVRRVDLKLEIGTTTTSIEVTAGGGGLIETETARIGDARSGDQMRMMPIPSRGLWAQTLMFAGGMTRTAKDGNSGGTSYAGSQPNQINILVDGSTTEDGVGSSMGPMGNFIESYDEVKVDIANNSAEFRELARISVISKAGTNQFRGGIFDYYQTPSFRAIAPFATQRSGTIQHEPGGSLGGPVILPGLYKGRDRTFFFLSYETQRQNKLTTNLSPTVPLSAWRNGDFSDVTTALLDPFTGQPIPNNRIPATRISSVSKKLQERFYPLPNYGDAATFAQNNFRQTVDRPPSTPHYLVGRMSHRVTGKDDVSGRYVYYSQRETDWESSLPTFGPTDSLRTIHSLTGTWSRTLTPAVVHEAQFTYLQNTLPHQGPVMGPPLVADLGLQGLAPNLPTDPNYGGVFKVSFSGVPIAGITQSDRANPGYENRVFTYYDSLSWFRGKHNLKAGGTYLYARLDNATAGSCIFGCVTFSSTYSKHAYADFLLGVPDGASRSFGEQRQFVNRWAVSLYAQDDYKISRKVTLNLGLRYDVAPSFHARDNDFSLFDPATGRIVVPDAAFGSVSPLMPVGYAEVVKASQAGLSQGLIRTDKNNFAIRTGVAWRPFSEPTTVVRAGYGIFFDVVPTRPTTGGVPFQISEPSYTNTRPTPTLVFPQVFPSTGTGGPSTVSLPGATDPNQAIPYSQQWNLTVEHERWKTGFRASYIGTNTRQMLYTFNLNQPVPDTRLYMDKTRPFPKYPGINSSVNGANHQYHALMLEAKRKMANGLLFQGALTWARDLGDRYTPENAFDRAREKGPDYSLPNLRYVSNFIYELPFGRGKKFGASVPKVADLVVGGWAISGIGILQTGRHMTIQDRVRDTTGTAFTSSTTPAFVVGRPDCSIDANLPEGERTLDRYFNTGAFTSIPAGSGRYGTCGRGTVEGPGLATLGAGLFKTFRIAEKSWLRWEVVANNALNHPNWADPGTRMDTAGSFGRITAAGGANARDYAGARALRMGLRLDF